MSNKKKILIMGCGGMLGEAFYHKFKKNFDLRATDIDVNESWLTKLDVRDYDAIKLEVCEFSPDYIFNLAAFTDLEYCENNIEETYRTNTMGAENGALISEEQGCTYIYISTAGIFDGDKECYSDFDEPRPLSIYGKSKYYGELSVREICSKYFIFRAGWMMGGGKKDKKFVQKIIKQILTGVRELHVVNDLKGSPTYTYDFANNIKKVLLTDFYGLYNMTCEGGPSRYEVAKEMLNIFGLTDKINLIEVDSTFFQEEYFAPRPDSEILLNQKLNLRKMDEMRDWKISLKDYLQKDWKHVYG